MANPIIELDPVTHITAGAVGQPGQRTFFIQAERKSDRVDLVCDLFQQGTDGTYWLGMEDKTKTDGSDFDYNDMIVEVSPVPEPGILLLLGLGLIGGAGVRRYTK